MREFPNAIKLDLSEQDLAISIPAPGWDLAFLSPAPKRLSNHTNVLGYFRCREKFFS
jgi:hypothetical protein